MPLPISSSPARPRRERPLALAVSPHLDDAVFSGAGLIARLADHGWRILVVTAFTRSVSDPTGFALACQLDKGLPPDLDYMALRRDEDAAACARLGADTTWLPFPEAPHRGYESAPDLFGPVGGTDHVGGALAQSLSDLVDRTAPDLVLAPQAIGGHVDHVITVDALDSIHVTAPVLWWRDFPYITREANPKTPRASRFAACTEIAVPIDLDRKAAACADYASQIGFQFAGREGLVARLADAGPVERFAHDPARQLPPELAAVLAEARASR